MEFNFKDLFKKSKSQQLPNNTTDTSGNYGFGYKTIVDSINNYWNRTNLNKGVSISSEQAYLSAVVCRCVNLIASKVANTELVEYKLTTNKKTPVKGDVDMLLNVTGDEITKSYDMKYLAVSQMLLHGNGYIIIKRSANQLPERLEFVESEFVEVLKDERGRPKQYIVKGEDEYIRSSDMIVLKYHQKNLYEGVGALDVLATEIGLSTASIELIKKYFNNGLKSEGFYTNSYDMSKPQLQQLKDQLIEMENTSDKDLTFLPYGVNYQAKQATPHEAQVMETLRNVIEQICSFFGVPLSYVYQTDSVTTSQLEEKNSEFIHDAIYPLLDQIEKELRFKFYTRLIRKKFIIQFKRFTLYRASYTDLKDFVTSLTEKGIFSINEARELLGWDSIGELGDIRTKQLNSIVLDIFKDYSYQMLENSKMKQENKEKQFDNPDETKDNQTIDKKE
ncbi:phage portal protein [Carboxylicivirga sp. M1479]|uniref:phage portal protein n=1 Tax=Carboxylicivirga sp. M1479 TaxID=2594476 RepID=UPI00117886B7|nr:phage portal protein [Carboxylicivirga sp. M1479]TRX71513.1 phage portal protein [Carboxylicivirga sp. M1479]